MRAEIERARLDCDSVGGVVEAVTGVPAGAGSPMFGGVENVFSSILFGIPAVKAVEFGDGFRLLRPPWKRKTTTASITMKAGR